jgi:hypothetical protein
MQQSAAAKPQRDPSARSRLLLLLLLLQLLLSLSRAAATSRAAGAQCNTARLINDQTLEPEAAQQLLALRARAAAVLWLSSRVVSRKITQVQAICCHLCQLFLTSLTSVVQTLPRQLGVKRCSHTRVKHRSGLPEGQSLVHATV